MIQAVKIISSSVYIIRSASNIKSKVKNEVKWELISEEMRHSYRMNVYSCPIRRHVRYLILKMSD